MQDNESILLTAEGRNGKIELTETSVRYTEYKKELLKWNPQNWVVSLFCVELWNDNGHHEFLNSPHMIG